MVPVISIAGMPDSGKTTLITRLIPELVKRGYTAGVIKHCSHAVELDRPGKDTARFTEAGACYSILSAPNGVALFRPGGEETLLEELLAEFSGQPDIILTEGYKAAGTPKIAVCGEELPEGIDRDSMIAIVSAAKYETSIPVFDPDDIAGVCDLIEKKVMKKVSAGDACLWVDGKFVGINPFVKAFIGQTVKGMINSLKHCKNPKKIVIKVGR